LVLREEGRFSEKSTFVKREENQWMKMRGAIIAVLLRPERRWSKNTSKRRQKPEAIGFNFQQTTKRVRGESYQRIIA